MAEEDWKMEFSQRRVNIQSQGAGAHPWLHGRGNGLDRAIYDSLAADGRFSSKRLFSEVQWRLDTSRICQ